MSSIKSAVSSLSEEPQISRDIKLIRGNLDQLKEASAVLQERTASVCICLPCDPACPKDSPREARSTVSLELHDIFKKILDCRDSIADINRTIQT